MSYAGRCDECLTPYQGEPPERCQCGAILNYALRMDATPDYVKQPGDDFAALTAKALGYPPLPPRDAEKMDDVLKAMVDGAHALIGTIDKQTYDEWKRHDWDAPDDCEFLVTFTAKELVLLDKIIDAYIRAAGKGRAAIHSAGTAPAIDNTQGDH